MDDDNHSTGQIPIDDPSNDDANPSRNPIEITSSNENSMESISDEIEMDFSENSSNSNDIDEMDITEASTSTSSSSSYVNLVKADTNANLGEQRMFANLERDGSYVNICADSTGDPIYANVDQNPDAGGMYVEICPGPDSAYASHADAQSSTQSEPSPAPSTSSTKPKPRIESSYIYPTEDVYNEPHCSSALPSVYELTRAVLINESQMDKSPNEPAPKPPIPNEYEEIVHSRRNPNALNANIIDEPPIEQPQRAPLPLPEDAEDDMEEDIFADISDEEEPVWEGAVCAVCAFQFFVARKALTMIYSLSISSTYIYSLNCASPASTKFRGQQRESSSASHVNLVSI